MIFRVYKDLYGLHFHFAFFKVNFQAKIHREYDLAQTSGIRNNCSDGSRLLFMDYDHHVFSHVLSELSELQDRFGLSEFYIFRSSQRPNSYHAMCLDKLSYREFLDVMMLTSCDDYYKVMPIENDKHSWVLRILNKEGSQAPRLVHVLKSKFHYRVKSQAHWLFLKYAHGVKKKPFNCDDSLLLYDIHYKTMNFVKKSKNIKEKKHR